MTKKKKREKKKDGISATTRFFPRPVNTRTIIVIPTHRPEGDEFEFRKTASLNLEFWGVLQLTASGLLKTLMLFILTLAHALPVPSCPVLGWVDLGWVYFGFLGLGRGVSGFPRRKEKL